MIRHQPGIDTRALPLLALAVLGLLPASSEAEAITFVNDTKAPLVVQMAIAVRGGIRRDRPYQVAPGEKVRVILLGNKLVNVYDARVPNRALFQGTLNASPNDQAFSIKPDPRGLPKVILEPVKPPATAAAPPTRDPP